MEDKAVQNTPVEKLICRPQVRTRFDEESLLGQAQTIKETGILQPLLVRREGSDFVVLDGERRLRAAKLAGVTHVPILVHDRELSDYEIVLQQLIANGSRKDLDPLDEARAIQRLMVLTKWPGSHIAVKLGKSPATVTKLLTLLSMPVSVQEKVANGSLSLTTAYALSQAESAESQSQIANEVVADGLTRAEVIERVKSRKSADRKTRRAHRESASLERVKIPLSGGASVAVAGRKLSLRSVVEWLTELLEKLRGLEDQSMAMPEAAKLIAKAG